MAELTELEIPEEILALREELTRVDQTFADLYLSGKSQTQAYRETHPGAVDATCWTQGWLTLRKPEVAAYVRAMRMLLFKRSMISVEEMLDFCARSLRTKKSDLFDELGNLRDEMSDLVQEYIYDPDTGRLKNVKLMSKKDAMALAVSLAALSGGRDDEEAQALARKIRPSLELPAGLDNPHS